MFSRAVEYQLDEVNKIATLVWEYRNSSTFTVMPEVLLRDWKTGTLSSSGVHPIPALFLKLRRRVRSNLNYHSSRG
ncbi:MAG: hypothetical protein R3A12_08400 [Ignavibacteria bacterium]